MQPVESITIYFSKGIKWLFILELSSLAITYFLNKLNWSMTLGVVYGILFFFFLQGISQLIFSAVEITANKGQVILYAILGMLKFFLLVGFLFILLKHDSANIFYFMVGPVVMVVSMVATMIEIKKVNP